MAEVKEVLSRFTSLKSDRKTWEEHWQRLAEVFLPRRADFVTKQVPGQRRNINYDSVPMLARRGLAASVDGLLKPKTQPWFFVRAEDDALNDSDDVRPWLEFVEDRMRSAIYSHRAGFIKASGQCDNDLVTFGTGALFMGERPPGGMLFRAIDLEHVFVQENADGRIDQAYVEMPMTVPQMAQRYGRDALPRSLTDRLDSGRDLDKKETLVWYVGPRDGHDPFRLDSKGLPFASIVIYPKDEQVISESGFHEFPFAVPRWDTSSGETYGRSPGMIALADANTLQAMGKTILMAGQKVADPPLLMPNDGVIGAVRTFPGGITYYDPELVGNTGRNAIGPMNTGANLPITREMQGDIREQVFQAFFRNVLQLPTETPRMTATEVLERKEEFIRVLGPVFGQLEADYPAAIVERVFAVMMRAGAFGVPPEALQGRDIKFEYRSPIQQAQKQVEAAALGRALELFAPLAQFDGSVLDHLDTDEIVRSTPDLFGLPIEFLRSQEDVETIRERRAEQQAQQAAIEQAQGLAGSLNQVAGATRQAAQAEQIAAQT